MAEGSGLKARWRQWLLELPRAVKRLALIGTDLILLSLALWGSISLRYGVLYVPENWSLVVLMAAAPLITVATFWWSGLYRLVTRYISYRGTMQIFGGVALSVLVWALLVFMSGQLGVPRSSILLYGFIAAGLIALSRQIAGLILKSAGISIPAFSAQQDKKQVIIYGTGQMGVQLLQSLRTARDRQAIGFVDISPSMWGQYVGGVKVYRPEKLEHLIRRAGVREVLLALPGSQRKERRQILQDLERLPVEVKVLPAYEDFASGRVGVADLRPVDVGELLGREPVQPSLELLERNTKNKSILVTGAGGSIGSELVRQILKQSPKRIVLLDLSEVALYEIEMEVRERVELLTVETSPIEVVGVLGSVLDHSLINETLKVYGIETIYHAAAYKHVPIVEHNPIAGLNNNVFGAAVIAECARQHNVERVVLISTDKAVRPTNVMGASKRLAELVLQAQAADGSKTVFTMVRFGNVLDSSGSVVRRFRKQIQNGGPVTVTHKDIERFFMSIPEAAELVIQAGAMAKGGEVFVLHMGEPVKIEALARLMIHLSGLEVRDEENPKGDIAIIYTGLRPGEKLYEELLIGANTTGTEHARIWQSGEPFLSAADLAHELEVLKAAMAARDTQTIQALLLRTVEGYQPRMETAAITGVPEPAWSNATRTLH
jgi:FlaA1/EpsC-like NDP-sugar epimerase